MQILTAGYNVHGQACRQSWFDKECMREAFLRVLQPSAIPNGIDACIDVTGVRDPGQELNII